MDLLSARSSRVGHRVPWQRGVFRRTVRCPQTGCNTLLHASEDEAVESPACHAGGRGFKSLQVRGSQWIFAALTVAPDNTGLVSESSCAWRRTT